MQNEDASDRFLKENLSLLSETPSRSYYHDSKDHLLVASWKRDRTENMALQDFQNNALFFADLIAKRRPKYLMVDCRHLDHQLSFEDQHWYIQQTRALWIKSEVKKIAFVFQSNLAVQLGMEGLKDAAQQEGIQAIEYRIFEHVQEAMNWVKS